MSRANAEPGTDPRRAPRCAGFTLMELVVVAVVLAILSAIVLTGKTNLRSGQGPARLSEVRSQLRYLQLEAMKNGVTYLVLKCDGTNYWAYNSAAPATYLALPGESSKTVSLSAKSMTMSSFTIGFDANGIPYSGASGSMVKLASALSVTITTAGQTGTLTLSPETGFIP